MRDPSFPSAPHEKPQQLEHTPIPPSIKEFLYLSPSDQKELEERVTASHGLVRAFVHPRYDERLHGPANTQAYIDAFNRLLELPPEKTPPILVFEEAASIDRFFTELKQVPVNNTLYLLPTYESDGDVKNIRLEHALIERQLGKPVYSSVSTELPGAWARVREILTEVGVKKILVAGQYLTFEHTNKLGKMSSAGCVDSLLMQLSPMFDIELSSLTYPENRTSFKKRLEDMGVTPTGDTATDYRNNFI